MPSLEIILLLFLAVAAVAYVAQKIHVPYPILLVVGGTALSFIPHLPPVELHPDLVFLLFLPPLLYYAGFQTSWRDFKANLRPILLLAVGLVLFTTVLIALLGHYLIDHMSWPSAFALGAIVSPPDAVAAAAIAQGLHIPKRIVTILEGESLVNDATALVIYRFAVAAAAVSGAGASADGAASGFSLFHAAGSFVFLAAAGIAIGYAAGYVASVVRARIDDPSIENIVSLLTPFFAYLPAEKLHASGVLAAVTAGIVLGRRIPKVINFRTRLRAYAVWDTLVFILNGLIFILIGLQLPRVVAHITEMSTASLMVDASLVCLAAILIRPLWVFPATYVPRRIFPALEARDPAPPVGQVAVLAWTGMRGIVSLAAALALPGEFPHRDLIIFLTFAVILATLVLQGLTLPALIRFLGLTDDGTEQRETRIARLDGAHAALARLQVLEFLGHVPADALERLRLPYEERIRYLSPKPDGSVDDLDSLDPPTCAADVERELLHAERRMVTFLRDQGTIGDDVLRRLHHDLDLQEAQLSEEE